jgi:FkbM family methyltransferase
MLRKTLRFFSQNSPAFKGKVRLVRLLDKVASGLSRRPIVSTIDGIRWELNTEDIIDFNQYYISSQYSRVHVYILKRLAQSANVFWDVGANVGTVMLRALALNSNMQGIAFEPSPLVIPRLLRNVALNPTLASRLSIVALPVNSKCEMVTFYPSSEPFNSGVGNLAPSANCSAIGVRTMSVDGNTILANNIARPDLIKIDVEGFEYEVMRGLEQILVDGPTRPSVVFEHSPYRLKGRGQSLDRVFVFLEERGFSISQILDDGIIGPFDATSLEVESDYVAT